MKIKNIYAAYFSPTGSSKKGALSIAHTLARYLGLCVYEINLTVIGEELSKKVFDETDLVVFGSPVYSGRLYCGALNRFAQLTGNNTPCVVTVTYGNRHYDDALLEMYELVKRQGFIPFAAAALVAQHTFGDIQKGRPNEDDLRENRRFALRAAEKLVGGKTDLDSVPGNAPYKDGGRGGSFVPQTKSTCIACGLCAKNCPEHAVIADDGFGVDPERCISCFACIKYCPVHAKCIDTPEYIAFAEKFSKQLATRRENEYFV